MKFEVEVSDEDASFLRERMKVDVSKLAQNFVKFILPFFKEFDTCDKAGVKMSADKIREFTDQIGRTIFQLSLIEEGKEQ